MTVQVIVLLAQMRHHRHRRFVMQELVRTFSDVFELLTHFGGDSPLGSTDTSYFLVALFKNFGVSLHDIQTVHQTRVGSILCSKQEVKHTSRNIIVRASVDFRDLASTFLGSFHDGDRPAFQQAARFVSGQNVFTSFGHKFNNFSFDTEFSFQGLSQSSKVRTGKRQEPHGEDQNILFQFITQFIRQIRSQEGFLRGQSS